MKITLKTQSGRFLDIVEADCYVQAINMSEKDLSDLALESVELSGTLLKGVTGMKLTNCKIKDLTLAQGQNYTHLSISGGTVDRLDLNQAVVGYLSLKNIKGNVRMFAEKAYLYGASFRNFTQAGMLFDGANLECASFEKVKSANLDAVIAFRNANLCSTVFLNCAFSHLLGKGVDLEYASFENVSIVRAHFAHAVLANSRWNDCTLTFTQAITYCDFKSSRWANCKLNHSSDLQQVGFLHCTLRAARFTNCKIRRAFFSHTILANTMFSDGTFSELGLADTNVSNCTLGKFSKLTELNRVYGVSNYIPSMNIPNYWHVAALYVGKTLYIQIGCQRHTYKQWEKFSDNYIDSMDSDALQFWTTWKDTVLKLANTARRYGEL